VFDNAAIAKRHLVAPHDWYEAPHGWAERNAVYLAASEAMFADAAGRAIAAAGLAPDQIDGVVTVSTTGIATPSLEARVGPRLASAPTSGACPSLASAAPAGQQPRHRRLAASDPGSHWRL
jgi:alkylresorcinol/alkylpyrone synthase